MATAPGTELVTAADLLAGAARGERCELIDGELHRMEPPGALHGWLAAEIVGAIREYARARGGRSLGETGFLLATNPDTVRAPDAAYVSAEKAERVGLPRGYWPGAPDLAVEVVSPGDTFTQVHEKALMWLAAGCRVVLVVDPAASRITRYRAADDVSAFAGTAVVDCAPAMPGFAPTVAELLAS